jgi:Protein of unknwon function (DUF3008)
MSSNNIYNILGKLSALTPKQPTQETPAQKVYESVDPRGSVLEGISKVEAKLNEKYMGFKKTVAAIKKSGSAENPEAVAAAIGRKKYGKEKFQKAAAAGKKMGEGSLDEPMSEKAVSQAQQKFMGMVHAAQKGEKPASPAVAKVAKDMGKKDARDFAATKHKGLPQHVEEATCNECGMYESKCSCDHDSEDQIDENGLQRYTGIKKYGKEGFEALQKAGREGADEEEKGRIKDKYLPKKDVSEGEATHTGGEKVKTDKGTIHKSKATVDTEKELSRGDVSDPDKDDEPVASAEKKGRGRPKKADSEKSQASLPWGGKPPKDTYKHQKGSFVHKISEGRMLDEAGETLEHILNRFKYEVREFEQGGDLDQDLYEALFDYYADQGEIPYGVAKARTGDPYEWVAQNLESHLRGGGIVGGNPDEDYSLEREAIGEPQPGIPGNLPVPGKMDRLNNPRDYYEEEATMENELNELARLAGLDEVSRGEYIKQKDTEAEHSGKKEFDAFGQQFKTAEVDEAEMDEGPEIFKLKADAAKKAGEKEFKGPDGNIYPVKESLLDIAKLAGLATEGRDYGDTDVEEAPEYANSPDEEEETIDAIIHQGADLNREKKQYANKPKAGDNPMATKESVDPLEKLGRDLLAKYESIKIQK